MTSFTVISNFLLHVFDGSSHLPLVSDVNLQHVQRSRALGVQFPSALTLRHETAGEHLEAARVEAPRQTIAEPAVTT